MSKKKWVREVVRRFIGDLAVQYPEWRPAGLRDHTIEHFKDKDSDLYVPGLDAFRKIASSARRPGVEDVPWSIGSATEAQVPSAALSDVLDVWCLTQLKGISFTVRQAKWVARLRVLLADIDRGSLDFEEHLYQWATRYAIRESSSETLNPSLPLDTTDLDIRLAFPREVDFGRQVSLG